MNYTEATRLAISYLKLHECRPAFNLPVGSDQEKKLLRQAFEERGCEVEQTDVRTMTVRLPGRVSPSA